MPTPPKAVPAFPLKWPKNTARTKKRMTSRFGNHTLTVAHAELIKQLKLLAAEYIVISTNVPLRGDGKPYGDPGVLNEPGAAIYFQLEERSYCLPCDRWLRIEDNLYAVAKHVEAMRGMERWGVGSVEQNFAGFKALPATAGAVEDWWTVLGVDRESSVAQIKAAHMQGLKLVHPDRGGSSDQMARVNTARDRALAEKAGK